MRSGGGIIYKVTNLITNQIYIGKTTKTLTERINSHMRECKYHKNNNYFHNALLKYGDNNFKWEIIFEGDELILNVMETFNIIVNHSHKSEGGYNLTWGGDGIVGYRHTNETKKKMSIKGSGINHWNYGNHWDDVIKRKNSNTQKGRKLSETHKDKISKGLKGKYVGKKMSNSAKEKMRKAKIGLYDGKNNPNSKTYKILNIITNEIVVVDCLKEWCCKNNILYDSIRVCVDKHPYKKLFIVEKC